MGREIVRQESPSKPSERSRLWSSKDIVRVFKENKRSDKIEIIMLHLPKDKEVQWDGNALKNMENLKILVVKNARFSRGPSAFPKSLRVLIWCRYPESSLPANFDPTKLAILDLSLSFFTFKNQLIMKFKSFVELKLSGCKLLAAVPDMSGAPNLKKLHLDYCKNLVEVHDSVGFLDKLEFFNLNYCTSLRVLPNGLNLTSVKVITLRNCTSLMSFPEILGKMENIRYLDLVDSAISGLPFSIGNLVGLTILILTGCKKLLELPSSIFMLLKLVNFSAEYGQQLTQVPIYEKGPRQQTMFSSVRDARFNFCFMTDRFLATLLPCLRNVTYLYIDYSNITVLPSDITACHSLTRLSLNECKELQEIRDLPPNIKYLSAINCTSLTSESKEMLLNLTLHNLVEYFKFPGSAIPSWLNHRSSGPSLCLWFRQKFPAITLCAAGDFDISVNQELNLIINGMLQFPTITLCDGTGYLVETNHTIMSDSLLKFDNDKILHRENGWNSAEISLVDSQGITNMEWLGVYVREQSTNMADIKFTNPQFSVAEEQFQNQFSTADGDGAGPSSLSGHIKLMQYTVNHPESYFQDPIALLNKNRKRNDDLQ